LLGGIEKVLRLGLEIDEIANRWSSLVVHFVI
jgi:hypothetical protein